MSSFRDSSRGTWASSNNIEHINAGSLQRIADATELMAKNHADLIRDRDYWKVRCETARAENVRLALRIRSLRGVITRLKRRVP